MRGTWAGTWFIVPVVVWRSLTTITKGREGVGLEQDGGLEGASGGPRMIRLEIVSARDCVVLVVVRFALFFCIFMIHEVVYQSRKFITKIHYERLIRSLGCGR